MLKPVVTTVEVPGATKTVIVLRGIPGSGKSTYSRERLIGDEPDGTAVRINNDELVDMLFSSGWRRQPGIAEVLKDTREALLKMHLQTPLIETIVIDNTNLNVRTVADLQKIALRFGANFEVNDTMLRVDVETCIARDAVRPRPVGEDVIRKMAKEAAKLGPWKSPDYEVPVIEKYVAGKDLPPCYIFDIDGTLALNVSGRDMYNESRVSEDAYNKPVWFVLISLLQAQVELSTEIIFMSGRHEKCRRDTEDWLSGYAIDTTGFQLYMRADDDNRPDFIVKYELFQQHIAGKYRVLGCFDDRDQVVDLWRNKLGLPTFQVANGDF